MRVSILILILFASFWSAAQNFHLFVGTYTGTGSKGIYVYRFNASAGKAEWVSNTDSVANPSYLALSSNGKYVYAVNQMEGAVPGRVSSFAFDRATGKLSFLSQQLSGGEGPCYITVNSKNTWVFTGNYTSGSLSALPVDKKGYLKPLAQNIQHTGSSVDKERQQKPHVHSTVLSPNEDYLFVPDLGTDKVMIYRFNASAPKPLKPASQPFATVEAGNGPRHFTFHPNKKFAYLIEEMGGAVSAYRYYNGQLAFIQRLATHPADYKGSIGSADIHLSPDGKFLYASNRGDENTITIFSVDAATGKLQLVGYQPTSGKTPRNFIIDPTGNYLLVAHQNTDNIVIFKRDRQTGLLQPTGEQIYVPKPVCLKMISDF